MLPKTVDDYRELVRFVRGLHVKGVGYYEVLLDADGLPFTDGDGAYLMSFLGIADPEFTRLEYPNGKLVDVGSMCSPLTKANVDETE